MTWMMPLTIRWSSIHGIPPERGRYGTILRICAIVSQTSQPWQHLRLPWNHTQIKAQEAL
jgi:hypothetical protein